MFRILQKTGYLIARLHTLDVPTIDLTRYLEKGNGWEEDCRQVANTIRDYGVLYVKDPRADYSYNGQFLDLMEAYFDKRSKQLEAGEKGLDTE